MTESPKRAQRRAAIEQLREVIKPGATIYTSTAHIAKSGDTLWLRVFLFTDGRPLDISALAAQATGTRYGSRGHDGIERKRTDPDMAYSLWRMLYPELGSTALTHQAL